MANIVQTRKFVVGDEVTHTKLNDIAGSASIEQVKNADFDAAAAIVDTKLATITSANKVNTSALTTTDQAAGDIMYNTGTGWTRKAKGTALQELRAVHDSYTKLLLTGDGLDGGVTFTDDSQGIKTVTNTAAYDSSTKLCSAFNGDDGATEYTDPVRSEAYTFVGNAQLDTAQKKFGTASLLLDGTGDYVTLADSSDWDFDSGAFTIDMWVRFAVLDGVTAQTLCGQTQSSSVYWRCSVVQAYNRLQFISENGSGYELMFQSANGSFVPVVDTWYHIAFVRNGSNVYIFVNGTALSIGSSNIADSPDITADLRVGEAHNGWIDELRITKGVARWTAAFTVPPYPYGQVVTSTAQKKFGTASGYFDGSGSKLSLADNADWNFANGDFTIDLWVRFNSVGTYKNLVTQYPDGNRSWGLQWHNNLSGNPGIAFSYSTDGSDHTRADFTNWTPTVNTWYHIAVTRNSANLRCFVDGTQLGSTHNMGTTTINNSTDSLYIGIKNQAAEEGYLDGYIDELRISKGTARWTTTFTPETAAYAPALTWVTV